MPLIINGITVQEHPTNHNLYIKEAFRDALLPGCTPHQRFILCPSQWEKTSEARALITLLDTKQPKNPNYEEDDDPNEYREEGYNPELYADDYTNPFQHYTDIHLLAYSMWVSPEKFLTTYQAIQERGKEPPDPNALSTLLGKPAGSKEVREAFDKLVALNVLTVETKERIRIEKIYSPTIHATYGGYLYNIRGKTVLFTPKILEVLAAGKLPDPPVYDTTALAAEQF